VSEATIHVAVTAWIRCECARITLESFWRHNRIHDFKLWFGLDGGQEAHQAGQMLELFAAYGFEPVVIERENVGAARLTDHLIWAVSQRVRRTEDDLVLLLQDDWECVRPIPIGTIRELFGVLSPEFLRGVGDVRRGADASAGEIGSVWLYGRFRERDEKGQPIRPVGTRHEGLHGNPPIIWTPAMISGEQVKFGRAYWAHPPAVTRLDLAVKLTRGARDEKESFARSGRMDFLTAWLQDPVFWHIGRQSCWRDMGGKR
jgi:hypothetical protein